ncbi:hypothetical protein AVEN_132619-1 [Araneus ventricosus]|uniref:Uncharacterized protein n=1 Tax=Araneus ventricosus TaxID=182803 RepID=A0A4Y2AXW7_ARAVE|nr:hypothetical protein AVEN_132619-1 [Araneus ventricosus]
MAIRQEAVVPLLSLRLGHSVTRMARWPKVKVLVAALEKPASAPEINHCSSSERLKENSRPLKEDVKESSDQQSDSSEEDDTYPDTPQIHLER